MINKTFVRDIFDYVCNYLLKIKLDSQTKLYGLLLSALINNLLLTVTSDLSKRILKLDVSS